MRAERLLPTRVYRFYRGGALLGQLRGEAGEDDFFPEDWIGSVTFAPLLVVEGEGKIDGALARPGATFVVTGAAERIRVEGDIQALQYMGPDQGA